MAKVPELMGAREVVLAELARAGGHNRRSRDSLAADIAAALDEAGLLWDGTLPPLAGAREAADAYGVDRRNLYAQATLPDPHQELRSGPVWPKAWIVQGVKKRDKKKGKG